MAETQATTTAKPNYSRRTLRKAGRMKRKEKIQKDKEFAKTYFEAKSKRSNDKKNAFRKRHGVKKTVAG